MLKKKEQKEDKGQQYLFTNSLYYFKLCFDRQITSIDCTTAVHQFEYSIKLKTGLL
jgi:hypothetical protein